MRRKTFVWAAGLFFSISIAGRADFKYTVSFQISGPLSSKLAATGPSADAAAQAAETTTYVKGGYLRIDLPDRSYVIGDLKAHREIWVNPAARSYSVLDYGKMFGPPPPSGQPAAPQHQNLAIKAPTVTAESTGKMQSLLGQNSQQVVGRFTENADEFYDAESWSAPSVAGFGEVEDFYSRLAGAFAANNSSSGAAAGSGDGAAKANGDLWLAMELVAAKSPAAGPAMARVISDVCDREGAAKGLPMLQTLTMVRMLTAEQQARLTPGGPQPAPRFAPPAASPGNATPVKSAVTEAQFTFRVTSYSADRLDDSLFQVPSGYAVTELSKKDTWPAAILP